MNDRMRKGCCRLLALLLTLVLVIPAYGQETLDALAERFFISKYHLLRKFEAQVGTTVHRYILQKRLLNAKQLLAGGLAPSEVCTYCGFGDYANFYRAFRAEYGTTPRQYVQSLRG